MNTNPMKSAAMVLMPMALVALASCATTMSGQEEVAVMKTKDGAIVIETFKTTAKVTAIDSNKRKLTLTTPDGKQTRFKAGPDVVNFDQIQIGDQVSATVTEELAVFLRKDGEPPSAGEATAVALAPVGAKPGMLMADTVEITAKISAIDTKHRKVTFQFEDGTTKEVKVGKDIHLDRVKPGDSVTVRMTEGIAILVEKA